MNQLTLPVIPPDSETFASFDAGSNGALLATLCNVDEPMVYLWGEPGSGKTHLLRALCADAAAEGQRALTLDLAQCDALSPQMLQGLEALDWVCLDNVGAIAGVADWESGVFDLCNRMRERGACLRVAAGGVATDLGLLLPDLVSRLEWGPVFALQALDDVGKARLLELRANARGLKMPADVQRFLLRHLARDNHSLMAALQRLDDGSLQQQRHLTVPFVKQVLGL